MKLEILLAAFENISCGMKVVFGLITILSLFIGFFLYEDGSSNEKKTGKKLLIISLISLILCTFFIAVPSIDDVWKVRIGLIKLELANKENISKATETIERIGAKLECKYLGCKEEKKP